MLNGILRNDYLSLVYCMNLLRHWPDTFTQSIAILIETKQSNIQVLVLTTT